MKRVAAILLSLTFLWLQVVASARPASFAPAPQVCTCCDCKQTNCCVRETPSEAPQPAALPANANAATDFPLFTPTQVRWTLPVAPTQFLCSDSAPLPTPAVPLFTRHCALLI
jgi:hypothetical protein